MRLLEEALAGLSGSSAVMVFVFWGLYIWEGDARWGNTAGLFLVLAIMATVGSVLAGMRKK